MLPVQKAADRALGIKSKKGLLNSLFSKKQDEAKEEAEEKDAVEHPTEELIIDQEAMVGLPKTKGIYLYGGPGSGKTFMMDLFYTQVDIKNKRRASYTNFVLQTHKNNHIHYKNNVLDPLFKTSLEIGQSHRLFCFDEVQITEPGDAILMRRLFDIAWKMGVVLVATSNRPPDDLYRGGIQREFFLPFIDEIKKHCHVIK